MTLVATSDGDDLAILAAPLPIGDGPLRSGNATHENVQRHDHLEVAQDDVHLPVNDFVFRHVRHVNRQITHTLTPESERSRNRIFVNLVNGLGVAGLQHSRGFPLISSASGAAHGLKPLSPPITAS